MEWPNNHKSTQPGLVAHLYRTLKWLPNKDGHQHHCPCAEDTHTHQPRSVLQPLWIIYLAFLHGDEQQRGELTRPSTARFFPHKGAQEKEISAAFFLDLNRSSEGRVEFLWLRACEWSERLQLRDKLSRAIKGEALLPPRGISPRSLSPAAERSFTGISAHQTGCKRRYPRKFQQLHRENKWESGDWGVASKKIRSATMCIIY